MTSCLAPQCGHDRMLWKYTLSGSATIFLLHAEQAISGMIDSSGFTAEHLVPDFLQDIGGIGLVSGDRVFGLETSTCLGERQ